MPKIESEPEFAHLWERGRRLYKYRSKVIAHRDLEVLSNNAAIGMGFTHNGIKAILDDSVMLFDRLAAKEGFEPLVPFSCENDLLSLVRDLSQTRLGRGMGEI